MARRLGVSVAVMALALAATASAEKPRKRAPKPADKPATVEVETAPGETPPTPEELEAALPPHIAGPKLVDLGHQVEVEVPAGMILLERVEARKMLSQSGDVADSVVAVIGKVDADWLVVIEYEDVGYVDDSDADKLDAGELLRSYQQGTQQQNVRRKKMGVPELFLDGWSERPAYKPERHHLVWGLRGHSSEGPVINFFTRILGRSGYLSVDLIDSPDKIEQSKLDTAPALAATRFKVGHRYEDHESGDKSSGVGLRALVLGGTGLAVLKAAKAGFLIKLLLIFKKGFIVIFVAIAGLLKWLLGRKKSVAVEDPSGAPTGDPEQVALSESIDPPSE